jgi:hydrogenase nickel incorporation protein HypB
MDLQPHLDFDLAGFRANLRQVNPKAEVIEVSARNGDRVDEWCDWLRTRVAVNR